MKAVRPVRLKWSPLPSNKVGRIPQHVREGEGSKEGITGDKGVIDRGAIPSSSGIAPALKHLVPGESSMRDHGTGTKNIIIL